MLAEHVVKIQPQSMRVGAGRRPALIDPADKTTVHAVPARGGQSEAACGMQFTGIIRLSPPRDWVGALNPRITRCPDCIAAVGIESEH